MLKSFALFAIFALAVFGASAQEPEKELETLRKRRNEVFERMTEKRRELIANDPEFKKMHEKIMSLHRELALQLDKTKEIAPLAKEAKELDAQIKKLEAEIAEKDKQKENASQKKEQ